MKMEFHLLVVYLTTLSVVGKPEGKRPLGRQRRRWILGISGGCVEWIQLAQDKGRWRDVEPLGSGATELVRSSDYIAYIHRLMKSELVGIWKETDVAYYPGICQNGLRETAKILSQVRQTAGHF
jgi:hypothetical protein